ncbi:MAG: FecR family protein [Pseudobacter sp.]|uniref:FecR family protein n=1 Tax=Pseudobacter sp. TaxID=2045420 RepID=UPI003F815F17
MNVRFKIHEGVALQPEEQDLMEKWLQKTGMPEKVEMSPEKMEAVLFVLKNRMTAAQFAEKLAQREKEKAAAAYKNTEPETKVSEETVPYKKISLRPGHLALAAAVLCAIYLGIITIRTYLQKEQVQEMVKREIVQTRSKEIKSGVLPDGSKYWVNASSTISFPSRFDGTREVELNGEAYFEVRPVAGQPFIVSSKGQKIQVLGTEFNVSAYQDDTVIRTTVLGGSVLVEALNKKQLLQSRQQSVLNASALTVLPVARPEDAVAWKRDSFSFKQAYITEIAAQLSRYYEVKMEFSSGVNNDLYTLANFSRKEPITRILHMIESTNNITFDIPNSPVKKGDVIIIRKK